MKQVKVDGRWQPAEPRFSNLEGLMELWDKAPPLPQEQDSQRKDEPAA